MRTKKFNERCERIFNFLNHLNDSSDYTQEVPIVNLIFPNSFYDQLHIVISKDKNNEFKVEEIVDLAGQYQRLLLLLVMLLVSHLKLLSLMLKMMLRPLKNN